jgi:hypothetical protein
MVGGKQPDKERRRRDRDAAQRRSGDSGVGYWIGADYDCSAAKLPKSDWPGRNPPTPRRPAVTLLVSTLVDTPERASTQSLSQSKLSPVPVDDLPVGGKWDLLRGLRRYIGWHTVLRLAAADELPACFKR